MSEAPTQGQGSVSAESTFSRGKRSITTNRPLRRHSGHTTEGKRARDLFRAFSAQLGDPTDVATQARILALVELMVLAEAERLRMLARPSVKATANLIQLDVRIEHARRDLGLTADRPPRPARQPRISAKELQRQEMARNLAARSSAADPPPEAPDG